MKTKDRRYSINLEFCGRPEKWYVLRFCDCFVMAYKTRKEAEDCRERHKAAREKELTKDF